MAEQYNKDSLIELYSCQQCFSHAPFVDAQFCVALTGPHTSSKTLDPSQVGFCIQKDVFTPSG